MRPPNSDTLPAANTADNNNTAARNEINGFKRLDIPSDGYISGHSLFPRRVMAGYHAEPHEYDADSWAAYIVEKCKGFGGATTAVSFSGAHIIPTQLCINPGSVDLLLAINSGDTGGRFWIGYAFSGRDTTVADFEEDDEVHGLRVYTSESS
ncbi:hypothetical protein EYR40_006144 [Pleurotus pulmonarius]|nr:hypothetical protein EYR36_010767 [Pleurotus pulmonarius]KAF4599055.1 hypothetical protein EYR40_006144 [Pleurotus pulmonarius]